MTDLLEIYESAIPSPDKLHGGIYRDGKVEEKAQKSLIFFPSLFR